MVTVSVLLVGFLLVSRFSSHPATALVPLVVATLVGSDYAVLDKIGASQIRGSIEGSNTEIERIERSLGAKEILDRNEYLELDHQGGRYFMTTVSDEPHLQPPLPFRLHIEQQEYGYKLVVGRCLMTKVREGDGGEQVLFFHLRKWEMSSDGDDEREAIFTLREAVRNDDVSQTVYASPVPTEELHKLRLEEWRRLHALYSKVTPEGTIAE